MLPMFKFYYPQQNKNTMQKIIIYTFKMTTFRMGVFF